MNILTFLKGGTMNIKFNTAQLSRPQRLSLLTVLDVMQSENKNELEVTPVEFPQKLRVKLDDDVDMLLGWDVEKQSYAGLTKPEPVLESRIDTADLPPEPEKELDLTDVLVRADALACSLAKMANLFNPSQQYEIWARFLSVLVKELNL